MKKDDLVTHGDLDELKQNLINHYLGKAVTIEDLLQVEKRLSLKIEQMFLAMDKPINSKPKHPKGKKDLSDIPMEFINSVDAKEILGFGDHKLKEYRDTDKIPYFRRGAKAFLYLKDDVLALKKAMEGQPDLSEIPEPEQE